MKNQLPTIHDVAKLAQVSTSTVSHVINETRFVSDSTRRSVIEAMDRIGYQQNMLARSLRQRRSHTIGLVVADIMNPFFAEVSRAMERELLARGYNIILANSDDDPRLEKKLVRLLVGKQVDGLAIVVSGSEVDHIQALLSRSVPLVLLSRTVEQLEADSVSLDNFDGARRMTSTLIEAGHERVGFIIGSQQVSTGRDRLKGHLQALSQHGLQRRDEYIKIDNFNAASGYLRARELLALPEPPSALLAGNNLIAVGVLDALQETAAGDGAPQLAIIDEEPWFRHLSRPLLVASQPVQELGSTAARLLLERLEGRRQEIKRVVLAMNIKRMGGASTSAGEDRNA